VIVLIYKMIVGVIIFAYLNWLEFLILTE